MIEKQEEDGQYSNSSLVAGGHLAGTVVTPLLMPGGRPAPFTFSIKRGMLIKYINRFGGGHDKRNLG
jgi:hypothetical protein